MIRITKLYEITNYMPVFPFHNFVTIRYPYLLLFFIICSCSTPQKEKVDLIVHNAVVYTVDSIFSTAESFAVKDGKIIAVGENDSIL